MKKIAIIILTLSLFGCGSRKTNTLIDKENTSMKASSTKQEEASGTSQKESFINNSKKESDSTVSESSNNINILNTLLESQKLSKKSILLKNNGNILNPNLIGNLVLQNASGDKTIIPIASNTEVKIEDEMEIASKLKASEESYNLLSKKYQLSKKSFDSLSTEKTKLEYKYKQLEKQNTELKQSKKHKSKETEKKGLGFWGYLWLVLLVAICSVLIWEFIKKKIL